MSEYITFISSKTYFLFEIEGADEKNSALFQQLSFPFSIYDKGRLIFELPYVIDEKKRSLLTKALNSYTRTHKEFFKAIKFINDLSDGECFYLIFGKYSQEYCMDAQKSLEYYNQKYDHKWVELMMQDYIKHNNFLTSIHEEIEKRFKVDIFWYKKKIYLGEKDKHKRSCRYCKRNMDDGAFFKKQAHAISIFLGNTTLIQNEECDDCNEYFGNSLEENLKKYTTLFRVFSGIKGRNGIPKLQNNKVQFSYNEFGNGLGMPSVIQKNINTNEKNIELENEEAFIPMNVYKIFCKFFFSVIDLNVLENFDDTRKWIRYNDFMLDKLPPIAYYFFSNQKVNQPKIAIYIEKHSSSKAPFALMELQFGHFVFIIQIPSKNNKDRLFYTATEYNDFLRSLPHYKGAEFVFYDFSDEKETNFKMNFFIEEMRE